MKKRRLLALLLCIVLAVSLCAVPVSAKSSTHSYDTSDPSHLPTILLHGLLGFGSYDKVDKLLPYFGMACGSLVKYLDGEGYDVYTPSVGPFSSAWDRACELYAQLTGTRTDYGEEHSKKYGHDRYGRDFTGNALIENFTWDADHPINLVGHSFGGATSRMLLDMLVNGRPEEVAASGSDVSPLFTGGKKGWVYSLTAIAAPSNGTTFIDANPDFSRIVTDTARDLTDILGATNLRGVYDPMLDQFGIYPDEDATLVEAIEAVMNSDFKEHHDSAMEDLTIQKACAMNEGLQVQDDVYYFSYYGDRTEINEEGVRVPTNRMNILLVPEAKKSCVYTGMSQDYYEDYYGDYYVKVPVISQVLDEEWQPCDGMVPIISGRCPYSLDANGNRVYDPNVDYVSGMTLETGKWYCQGPYDFDHVGFVGGLVKGREDPDEVHALYDDIMNMIAKTAKTGSDVEDGCPTANMTDVDHSAWYHAPVDYVVSRSIMAGTSANTFEPNSNLSRAMIVQMLYALEGRPTTLLGGKSFSDVAAGEWYYDAVRWASQNSIVAGYEDGTFKPNQDVTREELAVILQGYAKSINAKDVTPADLSGFSDADSVESWAVDGMKWAVGAGLIAGRENKTLAPQGTATRAEAAQMLTNFCKTFNK